jgi:L-fuconolactonase
MPHTLCKEIQLPGNLHPCNPINSETLSDREEQIFAMSLDVSGQYRYPPPDPGWLSRRVEDVLDPGLPIIDAHHHLWIEQEVPYLANEITADVRDGHAIGATVFVQANYNYRRDLPPHLAPIGETETAAAIAAECAAEGCPTRVAAAIVAHADLTLGERLNEVLDAHEAAGKGAFRGIRHSTSRDPNYPEGIVMRPAPAGLLGDHAYRAGMARLAARGISYDAMLYHSQIGELTEAARALPDLSIVLDHIGCIIGVGPYRGREQETFREWRASMAGLAECPNVAVKLGGFGMIVCGPLWHEEDRPPSSAQLAQAWQPYVETCIELFGADRCMFESNFPVDKAMYSYRTVWNAFKRLTQSVGPDERHALFSGTASRFYRIADPALG